MLIMNITSCVVIPLLGIMMEVNMMVCLKKTRRMDVEFKYLQMEVLRKVNGIMMSKLEFTNV